jgi:poly-gamma-glutamate synthesis protein (capsule biosynthesis protein)
LLFAGDVMLGRNVAPIAANDPTGLFENVRFVVSQADMAACNLESPLTTRPHQSDNEYALEADAATAPLLAAAGFDAASVANNHTGDAGPGSVLDTIDALTAAGMIPVGAGDDLTAATAPVVTTVGGLRIGFVAFDATGYGLIAGTGPGAAPWISNESPAAVRELAATVDVVVASMHSGTEYLPVADEATRDVAAALLDAGADVVWGHGPHVPHRVTVHKRPGTLPAVAATSLGNFLFDQRYPGTEHGIILEVIATADGVVAYRVGDVSHEDRRVHFDGWRPPEGSAAYLGGAWWSATGDIPVVATTPADPPADFTHDVIAAAAGDATGDGEVDLVVAYRRPFEPNPINQLDPNHPWQDAEGRSAHIGVYRLDGTPQWRAGTLLDPVDRVAVCDGAIAVGYGSFATDGIVATGVLEWRGFGLSTAPVLEGPGTPACADVDRDGLLDPVVLR